MKFIKEYNNQERYYHGTDKDLSELKQMPKTSGESKFLGDGIYITNSKEAASEYGANLYRIELIEPLNSLHYFGDIDNVESVIDKLRDMDQEYLAESLEENKDMGGKSFIAYLEREELDVNETLIELGFNAIEAPLNRMNSFLFLPDSDRNINVIKEGILRIV